MAYGKKVWIFPDAELPPVGVNIIPGHESIIITNAGEKEAHIKITLLYTDKPPVKDIGLPWEQREYVVCVPIIRQILVSIPQLLKNSMRLCWKVMSRWLPSMEELSQGL